MTSLDHEMAAILLRLELVSHGTTQAWNPSGGHSGEPDDKIAAQAQRPEKPPHIRWWIIYHRQTTDAGRLEVITDARQELESWTRRTAPRIEGKTLVELILEDGEGFEPQVVAQRYGVDVAFVRRKRMIADKDTETGRAAQPHDGSVARCEEARELRRRGMSSRQIALILGVSQSAVMKWTRKQAS